uniref:Head to tail joining protein n=1 Tax=Siphoviridae sp. ctrKX6 TaxID=2826476 RepID=A0A8S5NIY4_9CAUD|nr:MAG TPA: Head to tail joining protein [Siphoviridae sp. ctrKX6]
MAITNVEILKIRLIEAEEAYHKLMIGEKEVSVSVGSFGSTTYNQASRTALESYISSLKSQIAAAEGTPTCRRRIMKVSF